MRQPFGPRAPGEIDGRVHVRTDDETETQIETETDNDNDNDASSEPECHSDVDAEPHVVPSRLGPVSGTLCTLDARSIHRSPHASREQCAPGDPRLQALIRLVASTGGNTTRILVRRIRADHYNLLIESQLASSLAVEEPGLDIASDGMILEVVSGHRCLQACLELDLPVHALVADGISDEDALRHMHFSNAGHETMSALEQGRWYRRLLDSGQFKTQLELCKAFCVWPSDVSNALKLLEMPAEIARSFGPRGPSHRHAKVLMDAYAQAPEVLLARAAVLVVEQQDTQAPSTSKSSAAATVDRLLGRAPASKKRTKAHKARKSAKAKMAKGGTARTSVRTQSRESLLEPDALDQTKSDVIEFIAPSVLPDDISLSNGRYPLVTMAFGDAAVMTVLDARRVMLDFGPVDLDAQDHDWLGVQFGLLLESAPFLLRWAGQGGAASSVDGGTP